MDRQGHDVLNFQITMTFILFAFVLVLIVIPSTLLSAMQLVRGAGTLGDLVMLLTPIPILFVAIFTTYQGVVKLFRALSYQPVHYPFSLPFVK